LLWRFFVLRLVWIRVWVRWGGWLVGCRVGCLGRLVRGRAGHRMLGVGLRYSRRFTGGYLVMRCRIQL
jgi:hypothetical protein